MLNLIASLVGLAGPLKFITGKLADLGIARAQAKTDQERNKIDEQIEEAHDRRAVLVAEANQRIGVIINAGFRAFLAMPAGIVLWKLLVWDKVVGSFMGCAGPLAARNPDCVTFRTDPLDVNQWAIIGAVAAFYFAYDIFSKSRR